MVVTDERPEPWLVAEQWAGLSLAFWVSDTVIAAHARGGDVDRMLHELTVDCSHGRRPSAWPWPAPHEGQDLDPSVVAAIGATFDAISGRLRDVGLRAQFERVARRLIEAADELEWDRARRIGGARAETGDL